MKQVEVNLPRFVVHFVTICVSEAGVSGLQSVNKVEMFREAALMEGLRPDKQHSSHVCYSHIDS